MDRAFGRSADDLLDLSGLNRVLLLQLQSAVHVRVRDGAARIRFESDSGDFPHSAQFFQLLKWIFVFAAERAIEAVPTFENGRRPAEPFGRQERRDNPAVCRPGWVESLGPGSIGQIFDDTGALAATQAKRVDPLRRGKTIQLSCGCRRAERGAERCRVKTPGVKFSGRHQTHFAHNLDPGHRRF